MKKAFFWRFKVLVEKKLYEKEVAMTLIYCYPWIWVITLLFFSSLISSAFQNLWGDYMQK